MKANYINNNILFENRYNGIYHSRISKIYFKKLEITFLIPSDSKNVIGFYTMFILLEQLTNNRPTFLLDCNTLSSKKKIKVGLFITLTGDIMYNFIYLHSGHTVGRIIDNRIIFNTPLSQIDFLYTDKKILHNFTLSTHKDKLLYSKYLINIPYLLTFTYYTTTRNKYINKNLMEMYGVHITNEEEYVNDFLLQNAEIDAQKLEESELESELEDELEDELENDLKDELEYEFTYKLEDKLENKLEDKLENELDNVIEKALENIYNNNSMFKNSDRHNNNCEYESDNNNNFADIEMDDGVYEDELENDLKKLSEYNNKYMSSNELIRLSKNYTEDELYNSFKCKLYKIY